jgi:general secretion pathway protein K
MKSGPAFLPAPQISAGNRGAALLVVLGLLGLIAILVLSVGRLVSSSGLEIAASRQSGTDSDLRAAIELGAAAILKLGDNMRSAEAFAEINGKRISVHITNERARIDLNASSPEVLAALFAGTGLDKSEANSLARTVENWRGRSASQTPFSKTSTEDSFNQILSSAGPDIEDPGYMGAESPAPFGPQYFAHPTQLTSLPRFSKRLVAAILPFVTVANGSNQIDPFIAPIEVLRALPGVSSDNAEAFLEARDTSSRDTARKLLGANQALVIDSAAPGWRLGIAVRERAGHVWKNEAVIAVIKGDDQPFRVLYVDDGYAVPHSK